LFLGDVCQILRPVADFGDILDQITLVQEESLGHFADFCNVVLKVEVFRINERSRSQTESSPTRSDRGRERDGCDA